MTIRPCGHRLTVKPYKQEDVDERLRTDFARKLTIVNANKEREDQSVDKGVVLEIGPSAWKDFGGEPWCKVGDIVYFAKFAGKFIDDVVILNDADIVGVVQ